MSGAKTQSTQTKPEYSGLAIQTSAKGVPVTILYGTNRISNNMIWYGNFQAIPHTDPQASGGKGGGKPQGNVTYTYTTGVQLGLCAGPINQVVSIFDSSNKTTYSPAALGFSIYPGSSTQNPDAWLSGFAPSQALAYRGLANAICGNFDLGNSDNMPDLSFEVQGLLTSGGNLDVNPADMILDLLPNPIMGANYPIGNIAALTQFKNYCQALGLLISPVIDSQTAARDTLQSILKCCNAGVQESGGVLNILPYELSSVTGNGATFTPQTPQFNLTDNDFLSQDNEPPIKITRKRPADTYNQISVEYVERSNQYNPDIATYEDLSMIRQYGVRPAGVETAHFFTSAAPALIAAKTLGARQHIRNTYEFTLGWKYICLDTMDIVTLTDPALGLNQQWVRITDIEENENGDLAITAEDCLQVGWTIPGAQQTHMGAAPDQNGLSPNCYAPVIFEPPTPLCASPNAPEVWIGLNGPDLWGGAYIWLSLDGTNYKSIGVINGRCRTGSLTAQLPSGNPTDNTNTLSVLLDGNNQQLVSSSSAELNALIPLYYVDGELLCAQTATLTALKAYNLTTMLRGCYGTAIASHAAASRFARLDNAIFKYQAPAQYAGRKFYLKFQSFNIYGAGVQDISTLNPYTYTFVGMAYSAVQGNTAPVTVPAGGLQMNYQYPFPLVPMIVPTILNPQQNDSWAATNITKTGFMLYALNYSAAFTSFLSGGSATADSSNGSNTPGYAVDGSLVTYWQPSGSFPHWWKYDLGAGITKTARALNLSVPPLTTAATFTLEGSATGAFSGEQSIILTATMPVNALNQTYQWYFANVVAFRYYRLNFTTGDATLAMEEVNLLDGPLSVSRIMNWLAAATVATQTQSSGAGYGTTPYGTSYGN
jgi:hypothetical protein